MTNNRFRDVALILSTNKHKSPRAKVLDFLRSTSAPEEIKRQIIYLSNQSVAAEADADSASENFKSVGQQCIAEFGKGFENHPKYLSAMAEHARVLEERNRCHHELYDFLEQQPELCDVLLGCL